MGACPSRTRPRNAGAGVAGKPPGAGRHEGRLPSRKWSTAGGGCKPTRRKHPRHPPHIGVTARVLSRTDLPVDRHGTGSQPPAPHRGSPPASLPDVFSPSRNCTPLSGPTRVLPARRTVTLRPREQRAGRECKKRPTCTGTGASEDKGPRRLAAGPAVRISGGGRLRDRESRPTSGWLMLAEQAGPA